MIPTIHFLYQIEIMFQVGGLKIFLMPLDLQSRLIIDKREFGGKKHTPFTVVHIGLENGSNFRSSGPS